MSVIVNVFNLEPEPLPAPYAPTGAGAVCYEPRLARLAGTPGSSRLGANLLVLAPGKCAFPFHSHRGSDELFFIISGSGVLRYGEKAYPIREGDFISCHAGGPETAHQIRNDGTEELRYIAIGTNPTIDIVGYPDTNKFKSHTLPGEAAAFDEIARVGQGGDYWDVAKE